MIAALFVETNGAYFGLQGIDPWDELRDARAYPGPFPIVAHPPCQRWGKMWFGSPNVVAKTGVRKIKGDDGGCFQAALYAVRTHGGVIEHPWGSHAWSHFGLNLPPVVADGLLPTSLVVGLVVSSRGAMVTMPANLPCCTPLDAN